MKIRYFAWLREKIGFAEEEVAPPDNVRTVRDLINWLSMRSPGHRAAFERCDMVRSAIEHEFVGVDASVSAAREIGFFPPVTGG